MIELKSKGNIIEIYRNGMLFGYTRDYDVAVEVKWDLMQRERDERYRHSADNR